MRKILLLILMTVALFVNAQGHMTFKGIEIDGTVPEMVKKLEGKGYTKLPQMGEVTMLTGTFTGQDVMLGLYTTPVTKTVYGIMVIYMDNADSWALLSGKYEGLKERLTSKYGEPDEVIEKFDWPYSQSSSPLYALRNEHATYKTRFKTDNGGVTLSIIPNQSVLTVGLFYWDKENFAKNSAEVEDEL